MNRFTLESFPLANHWYTTELSPRKTLHFQIYLKKIHTDLYKIPWRNSPLKYKDISLLSIFFS